MFALCVEFRKIGVYKRIGIRCKSGVHPLELIERVLHRFSYVMQTQHVFLSFWRCKDTILISIYETKKTNFLILVNCNGVFLLYRMLYLKKNPPQKDGFSIVLTKKI